MNTENINQTFPEEEPEFGPIPYNDDNQIPSILNLNREITLALDFDGVIHKYSEGWKDGSIYDEAIPGAIEFIAEMMHKHQWSIFIMSTRDPHQIKEWFEQKIFKPEQRQPFSLTVIDESVQKWTAKNNLGITNRKLQATVYVDDRALNFQGTYDDLHLKIHMFRTWANRE